MMIKKGSNHGKRTAQIVAYTVIVTIIGTALPVTALASQGDSPMIPINVEIGSLVPASAELEKRLITVTEDVVRKNLPEILAQSARADASASILEKSAQGYVVEVLVVSLFKQTFTAQLSRIVFIYKGDQVTIRSVELNFQPK